MNIVLAALKYNGFNKVASINTKYHFVLLEITGTPFLAERIQNIRDSGAIANEETRTRVEYYQQQRVFVVALNSHNKDADNTVFFGHLFLESEVTILDEKPATVPMQLRERYNRNTLNLNKWENVGNVYPTIKLTGYTKGYVLLFSEYGVAKVDPAYLQTPDEAFKRPTIKLATINAYDLGVSTSEKIITEVAVTDMGRCFPLFFSAHFSGGIWLDKSQFISDDQLEIARRKMYTLRQLQISEELRGMLASVGDSSGIAQNLRQLMKDTTTQERNWNMFMFAPNGPDYLARDASDYTRVTYLDANKVAGVLEKGGDPWTSTSRVSVSWSKLASKFFLRDVYTARHIELFHTATNAALMQLFGPEEEKPEMVLVTGDDIAKYYDVENYIERKGSLGSSCMRSVSKSYFGIYVENPTIVSLLISRDRKQDKIHGRALVWTIKGKQYLDRVYATTDIEQKRMENWAKNVGMKDIWNGRRGNSDEHLQVKLEMPYQTHYPYMDTMCYLDPVKGTIQNYHMGRAVSVRSTSGSRDHISGEVACSVSMRVAPKEVMASTVSKKHVLPAYATQLRTGAYEVKDEILEDKLVGGLIAKKQAVYAQMEAGKPAVQTLQSNPLICYVAKYSKFYPTVDCAFSILDKGFILKKEAVELPDGTYCSPVKEKEYLALLARRTGNKAFAKKEAPVYAAVTA